MEEDVQEKTTSAVNSLIILNNDRDESYAAAAAETKDHELKKLFVRLHGQSKRFSGELLRRVPFSRETMDIDEFILSGKLHRVWMDVRSSLMVNDRKIILSSCEFGETVVNKTYEDVLEYSTEIPADIRFIISRQKQELGQDYQKIRSMLERAERMYALSYY